MLDGRRILALVVLLAESYWGCTNELQAVLIKLKEETAVEHEKLQKEESQAKQQELNLTGIPTQMKWDLEARSGLPLDDVRVHYHSDKPAKLGALAYTQGTQVHIGPGQEGHLRHELGHVVQQKLGLVRPNAWYPGGLALNTEEALEQQADAIGTGSYCQPPLSAEMPSVQRFEDPVVQAQGHITLESSEASDKQKGGNQQANAISLPDAPGPTIVFEVMGVTVEDCKEVYEQTKLYKGNTICVFGLNAKTGDATFSDQIEKLKNYQESVQQGTVQQGTVKHLLYTFSFQWTPTSSKNGYYTMPFVEARALVMQKAAEIVGGLQKPDGDPIQYKLLYRWIDADARGDGTESLDFKQLIELADKDGAAVMTGRYDWRSMAKDDNKIPKYKEFINQFNQAEKDLRDYYDLLSRTSSSEAQTAAAHRQDKKDKFFPGYYYPESTLMMNQNAHEQILRFFPVGGDPDNVLKGIGVSVDTTQDKESMRMLSLLNSPHIVFETKLKVTKPLKKEFLDGSYWGKEMRGLLRNQTSLSPKAFIVALKNVRQSAFDPGCWFFIKDADWNKWEDQRTPKEDNWDEKNQEAFNTRRRTWAKELYKFLDNNKRKIACEIKVQETISKKLHQ